MGLEDVDGGLVGPHLAKGHRPVVGPVTPTPVEDQPYQQDPETGERTHLKPDTALGFKFWLPVYNLRDQKGFEWLRVLHQQNLQEGREPVATGSRWPTTY